MKCTVCCASLMLVIISANYMCEASSRDAEVLVNNSVTVYCLKNSTVAIQWHHTKPTGHREFVYAGGKFWGSYRGRFRRQNDSHVLVFPEAGPDDAGLYRCSDEQNGSVLSSTQLTVLYSIPICNFNMKREGFVGPNTCNIQQENMTFTCAVSFAGNPPSLIMWSHLNGSQLIHDSSCNDESNRRSCTLTLRSDPVYDGTVLVCSTTSAHNCSTEVIKVQYFLAEIDKAPKQLKEQLSCDVRSNQNLTYSWKLKEENQDRLLSTSRKISTRNSGVHQCKVYYRIGNVSCSDLIANISVENNEQSEQSKSAGMTAALVSIGILSFLVVFGIAVAFLYRWIREKRRNSKDLGENRIFSIKLNMSKPEFNDQLCKKFNEAIKENPELFSQLNNRKLSAVAAEVLGSMIKVLIYCPEATNLNILSEIRQSGELKEDLDKILMNLQPQINETSAGHISAETSAGHILTETSAGQILTETPAGHVSGKINIPKKIVIKTGSSLEENRSIIGLTVLQESLFVSFNESQIVEVYESSESSKYKYKRNFNIERIKKPIDITSNESCLFVMGHLNSGELRSQIVKLDSSETVISEWSSGGITGRLSSYGSRVIVCLHYENIIKEFTDTGELICTVPLIPDRGFNNPSYAIKLPTMQFVVAFGREKKDLHGVRTVDLDGKLIKQRTEYDTEITTSQLHFKTPIDLCLLEKEQFILVAEQGSSRIVVLDTDLKYQHILLRKMPRKFYPARLSYDKKGGRLYVAVNKGSSSSFKDSKVIVLDMRSRTMNPESQLLLS